MRANALALALQAPVFEVVHDLEESDSEEGLEQERDEGRETERVENPKREGPANDDALQDIVLQHAPIKEAHTRVTESSGFERPGAAKLCGDGSSPEIRELLSKTRRRRIFVRGHPTMVAAQMLRKEMLIEHSAEEQATEILLPTRLAMNQLVGGNDRKTRVPTDDANHHEHVDGEDVLCAEHPRELEDDQELESREQVDQQIEGPCGKGFRWLTPLGFAYLVDEENDAQWQHEDRRDVPAMRSCPDEEQRDGRDHQTRKMPTPETEGFEKAGGVDRAHVVHTRGRITHRSFLLRA